MKKLFIIKIIILSICIAAALSACRGSGADLSPTPSPSLVPPVISESPVPSEAPDTIKATPTPKTGISPSMPQSTLNQQAFQSESKSPATTQSSVPEQNTVKISIIGDGERQILPPTEATFTEGQTVFDILMKVTREKRIQTEYSGVGTGVYIKGIDNLYEFDMGAQSGWLYSVNGEFPKRGCGAYKVKKGDVIEFKYTVKKINL
ncbi:MAG: hypothetical protein BWY15_00546 [Firmicutes bacterium ADurb.Bin193]|nr:MAG: hypothetical protein BWY15_00546 [Firmicutes bacterium ADurb.Bin193]